MGAAFSLMGAAFSLIGAAFSLIVAAFSLMGAVVKKCLFLGSKNYSSYLCHRLTDDSSFYPVRATATAQPLARAFFMARSQRV